MRHKAEAVIMGAQCMILAPYSKQSPDCDHPFIKKNDNVSQENDWMEKSIKNMQMFFANFDSYLLIAGTTRTNTWPKTT
jgi:hypothetical protein